MCTPAPNQSALAAGDLGCSGDLRVTPPAIAPPVTPTDANFS